MFTNSSMKLINYPIYGKRISDEQRNALNNGTQQEIQRRTQAEAEGRHEPETSMITVLGNPNLRGEIGSYLGGKKKASKKTIKKKITKKKITKKKIKKKITKKKTKKKKIYYILFNQYVIDNI